MWQLLTCVLICIFVTVVAVDNINQAMIVALKLSILFIAAIFRKILVLNTFWQCFKQLKILYQR